MNLFLCSLKGWSEYCMTQQHHLQLITLLMCIGDLKSTTRQSVIVAKNDNVALLLDDGLTCSVGKLCELN